MQLDEDEKGGGGSPWCSEVVDGNMRQHTLLSSNFIFLDLDKLKVLFLYLSLKN